MVITQATIMGSTVQNLPTLPSEQLCAAPDLGILWQSNNCRTEVGIINAMRDMYAFYVCLILHLM